LQFQTHDIKGLADLPPIHHSHPFTTPPEVKHRILNASLEHLAWGCNWLCDHLQLEEKHNQKAIELTGRVTCRGRECRFS